ncbi:MAG: hypothetical protein IT463_06060 [Planctomycetes bacterium]|nr:hypothetical protein [Planctomycetota bacterium]
MTEPVPETSPVLACGRRVMWSCGLCFALLFLLGLSGVASITLLYDAPGFHTTGLEGTVLDTVRFARPLIRALHTYGGYVAVLLCGWSALELLAFAKALKGTRWVRMSLLIHLTTVVGVLLMIISVLALTVTGVSAAGFLHRELEPGPGVAGREAPAVPLPSAVAEQGTERSVEWHTRELNYLLGLGALLTAAAVAAARSITAEARKPPAK